MYIQNVSKLSYTLPWIYNNRHVSYRKEWLCCTLIQDKNHLFKEVKEIDFPLFHIHTNRLSHALEEVNKNVMDALVSLKVI